MKPKYLLYLGLFSFGMLGACASSDVFNPKSQYPPDPWVKGYAETDDCLGGERLAAIDFALPDYPRRAFRSGRQGWVIIRLDVADTGLTENVKTERDLPVGMFDNPARKAVEAWTFLPPEGGGLQNCRVLIRFRAGDVTLGQ